MFNQMSEKQRSNALERLIQESGYVVSDVYYKSTSTLDSLHSDYAAPLMALYYPVSRDIVKDQTSVVGALTLEVGLESLFEDVLQGFEDKPLTAVVETSCGSQFSFLVRGDQVTFLGSGDLHENIPDVGEMEFVSSSYEQFDDIIKSLAEIYPTAKEIMCSYRVYTFPTVDFHTSNLTNRPPIIQALVGLVFLFTVCVFLGYDCMVERRQRRVLAAAQRTNALVSSLFPQAVRDRLVSMPGAMFLYNNISVSNDFYSTVQSSCCQKARTTRSGSETSLDDVHGERQQSHRGRGNFRLYYGADCRPLPGCHGSF
jgi:hypothetical protein